MSSKVTLFTALSLQDSEFFLYTAGPLLNRGFSHGSRMNAVLHSGPRVNLVFGRWLLLEIVSSQVTVGWLLLGVVSNQVTSKGS